MPCTCKLIYSVNFIFSLFSNTISFSFISVQIKHEILSKKVLLSIISHNHWIWNWKSVTIEIFNPWTWASVLAMSCYPEKHTPRMTSLPKNLSHQTFLNFARQQHSFQAICTCCTNSPHLIYQYSSMALRLSGQSTGSPYKQCVCLCSKYKEMYGRVLIS